MSTLTSALAPESKYARLIDINVKAAEIAKTIRILEHLTWPRDIEFKVLEAFGAKRRIMPVIEYNPIDYSDQIHGLTQLLRSFTPADPLERYTHATIQSFIDGASMVMAAGTPRVQELSVKLYGIPGDKLVGSHYSNIEAARRLTQIARSFDHPYISEPEACITAQALASSLSQRIRQVMGTDGPVVQISDRIAAKASASMTTVTLRPGTCFNIYDEEQLFHHEVMTHSLTSINGSQQPILKLMSSGSPRTTRTQEGLATFAEVVTASIDINRLERLALRIIAIDQALSGADFWQVYDFFSSHGQSDKESFWSTARIFRGGFPCGGIVFTKDGVYLDGLIKIHTLFRWALTTERLDYTHLLFCGRLTIEDIFMLDSCYKEKLISAPKYLPSWYQRIHGLAGSIGFSLITDVIDENELLTYFTNHCSASDL